VTFQNRGPIIQVVDGDEQNVRLYGKKQ